MPPADSVISLVDQSALARAGVKGVDLQQWVDLHDYQIGEESNRAYAQHDDTLIARLSPVEVLCLTNPIRPSTKALTSVPEANYRCYPVRRRDSHFWFMLTGARCPEMFAKLCAVNLSPDVFSNNSVAQTSVAKTSAIIVRHDVENTLCFYLLGESSTMQYVWACLNDALREFDSQGTSD